MFRPLIAAAGLSLLGTAGVAQAPIAVTSTEGAGEGSLRAAIARIAGTDAGGTIVVLAEGGITIDSGLVYDGRGPLTLIGNGQTITGAEDMTILTVSEGADLTVSGLSLQGPGGFSLDNRSTIGGGKGIFVDVRDDQTGQVRLDLTDVRVTGVSGHGIHVSDCSLADDCGAGAGGGGAGSPAGIVASLSGVTVEDAGNGAFDRDGVRLDERGPGGVRATINNSTFSGIGADGFEIDEGQDGDVIVVSTASSYLDNGAYCDPEVFAPLLPSPAEAEFDAGQMQEADIPGPITGSPDDTCVERVVDLHDDGSVAAYEFAIDLDDGFDIDEADAGSLRYTMSGGEVSGSMDQGMDMDEAGPGDMVGTYLNVSATGNRDDGLKHSEEDAGGTYGLVAMTTATGNDGIGVVFEEAGDGDAQVTVTALTSSGNDGGETGIEILQEDAGTGRLTITNSAIDDGRSLDGVDVTGE